MAMPISFPLLAAAAAVGVPALLTRSSVPGAFAGEGTRPAGWPVADLEVARAAVEATLAEVVMSRSAYEAAAAASTDIIVGHYPTPGECGMVEGSEGHVLLGLFTEDLDAGVPPTIVVFADNAVALQVPVGHVLWHELGHRWKYNHAIRQMTVGTRVAHDGVLIDAAPLASGLQDVYRDPVAFGWEGGSGCCLCRVHNHLAIAERLGHGAATETMVEHQVPPGIGGTIPLIREHLRRAQDDLNAVNGVAQGQGRAGEARSLGRLIAEARRAWDGWQSENTIGAASQATTAAWWASYRLTAALYRNGRE